MLSQRDLREIQLQIIQTLLITKQARLEYARSFTMNSSTQIECQLLQAEIKALTKREESLENFEQ